MTVTKSGAKYSQLPADDNHLEGSLRKNNAEHNGYVGVYNPERITENNITNANQSKDELLEQILDGTNMNKAFKKVKSNKGTGVSCATYDTTQSRGKATSPASGASSPRMAANRLDLPLPLAPTTPTFWPG